MLKENKVKMKPEGEAQGDDVQDVDYEEVVSRNDFFKSVMLNSINRKLFKINVEMYCCRFYRY
jgi:hypothetical protein